MRKTKRKGIQLLSGRKVSQDWETTLLSWPSLCGSTAYEESSIRLGTNVMYGHHHDIQQSSMTHMDGQKSAWSIGCLKDMRNEQNTWLGGRPINWSHAFAIVDFFTKGHFTVHVIQIIDGRTSLWGELING